MQFAKVTAIVRYELLFRVERAVIGTGACGMSVTQVRGEGELKDFFEKDWLVTHGRIEVFTTMAHAEELAQAIMEAAHTGEEGDGVVAILPVANLYRIRTRSTPASDDLEGKRHADHEP